MTAATSLALTALTATFAIGAAAQTRQTAPRESDPSIVTAEAPRATPGRNRNAEDLEFLVEALRTALAEVKMGELAAERGRDARVRDYGANLARDHAEQAAELEQLLEPLGVTIPEEPSAEALSHHAALARLPAEEFDAAFIQMMIWTHTEAIEKYGAQTHANPDRALADFASKSLPLLREHLAAAEALR
jgi:putative membrane protein